MTVNTASRRVLEKCGLTLVRTTPYKGAGPIEGAEHGRIVATTIGLPADSVTLLSQSR